MLATPVSRHYKTRRRGTRLASLRLPISRSSRTRGGFHFHVGDGLAFLRSYAFAGDELVYYDPPYLFETRSSGRTRCARELGDDHQLLLPSHPSYEESSDGGRWLDRIAQEGMCFTDYYGEQSCTAGRSSFITGQHGLRTGLTKVGFPAATVGLAKEDPTIAELLQPLGYATAQFGKNHLGDRNEYLPTVHGFDEFYGNLYHLNAEEEPELPDYPNPRDFPHFRERFGPRGVLDCKATDRDDATVDPRFGRLGKQTVHDTGPLTKERMETIDDDIAARSVEYIKHQAAAGKPFFLWVNFTHMHVRTHIKPESRGQAGRWQSEYHDVMIDHDKNVGQVLNALDEAGITDNTFVMYCTDNGPNMFTWPDGAMTPFRNEKNTNWEGAFRVPCLVRWPGKIKPGTVSNEIVAHHDWLPTFLAMAGDPGIKDKLLK